MVLRDIDFNRGFIIFSLALNKFSVIKELGVETLLLDSLSFFLLEFIHIVESLTASSHVNVFGCYTRLFEELNVVYGLVTN
jgi:hypothetical protein